MHNEEIVEEISDLIIDIMENKLLIKYIIIKHIMLNQVKK